MAAPAEWQEIFDTLDAMSVSDLRLFEARYIERGRREAAQLDVERMAAAIHTTGIANCAVECKDPPEFGGFSGADYDFATLLIEEYSR